MRHVVRLAGIIVGYSELEEGSPSAGLARGAFRPGVGYELVQPVFRLFAEAIPVPGGEVVDQRKLARYHQSRDALGLALEEPDGTVVPTSAIHIADYSGEKGPAARVIEVLIADEAYWRRRSTARNEMARG
jgi:hypothetical protein